MGLELKEFEEVIKEHGEAVTQATTELKGQINNVNKRIDLIEADGMRKLDRDDGGIGVKSVGSQVLHQAKSDIPLMLKGTRREMAFEIEMKDAITNSPGIGSPANTYPSQPQRGMLVRTPMPALRVLDLLPQVRAISNVYEFVRGSFVSSAASQQGEGATKPTSNSTFSLQQIPIPTIAHLAKVSKQVLDDQTALRAYLDEEMMYAIRAELENQVINGDGSTSYKINGLVNQATFAAVASDNFQDRISEAIALLEASGYNASAIVMHPLQWHAVRTVKDTTQAYISGSFSDPAAASLWSVPVILSHQIAQSTVLVIDVARAANLVLRELGNVELGYENDDWSRNLVTLRAELRAGLAVKDPAAMLRIPMGSPS